MKNELISIIIPVYNVQEYLPACLDSVIKQTYTMLEIILVDDGTPDQSGFICDSYAEKDRRITVIHKENGGLSSARNVGLKTAHGKWILFVDSDDIIPLGACENMLRVAQDENADIVVALLQKFYDTIPAESQEERLAVKVYNSYDILLQYFYKAVPGYICGKLIKNTVIGNITFPEGRLFEDTFTVPFFLERAERTAVMDYYGYYYRQNPNSICNSAYSSAKLDGLDAIIVLEEHFAGYGMETERTITSPKTELQKGILTYKFFCAASLLGVMGSAKGFQEDRRRLVNVVKETRRTVLLDKHNPKKIRLMALVGSVSPELLGFMMSKWNIIKAKLQK